MLRYELSLYVFGSDGSFSNGIFTNKHYIRLEFSLSLVLWFLLGYLKTAFCVFLLVLFTDLTAHLMIMIYKYDI